MASQSGVYRVIIIPFKATEESGIPFDEQGLLNKIATLVQSTSNVIISGLGMNYYNFEVFSGGAFHFGHGVRVEIWETTTGDANIVTNLPSFQTSLGVNVVTWSSPITLGF